GVASESVGAVVGAGIVHVLHGAPGGLSTAREQRWSQVGSTVEEGAELQDAFGSRLSSGDYDGDGFVDLAVGVPYEDVGSATDSGAVQVLYSAGVTGLSRAGEQLWSQAPSEQTDSVETGDRFGEGL
ncbi:FG-GAP repeat protein, partial [Corallococcus sp. AB038B]